MLKAEPQKMEKAEAPSPPCSAWPAWHLSIKLKIFLRSRMLVLFLDEDCYGFCVESCELLRDQ